MSKLKSARKSYMRYGSWLLHIGKSFELQGYVKNITMLIASQFIGKTSWCEKILKVYIPWLHAKARNCSRKTLENGKNYIHDHG